MTDISRLYDFLAGQPIRSQEVDDELNQLVARINDLDEDALSSALAAKLGISQTGTVSRGKSIIATEESVTSTSFAALTTPDRVSNVVLPADGLIVVVFQATWKAANVSAGNAAIHLNGTALQTANLTDLPFDADYATSDLTANRFRPLSSFEGGLYSTSGSAYAGDAATGQVISAGPRDSTPNYGAPCHIFAAAGTYNVDVRYKASTGSVTAKNRKLWVWTIAF